MKRWDKTGESKILAKKFGLELGVQNFTNPKTGKTEEHSFFTKRNGITICPVTTSGNLVLVRQYKQAIDDFPLEFPAGTASPGETPADVARRELLEETGYEPGNILPLAADLIHIAPRKSPSGFHVFAATSCVKRYDQNLDSGEAEIEILELSIKEFWESVLRGEIRAAETIVAASLANARGLLAP